MNVFEARKLWRDYFASGVDGVVFIVDAVDRVRFPEARKELEVQHHFLPSVICAFIIFTQYNIYQKKNV